jgi:hypothetical protein
MRQKILVGAEGGRKQNVQVSWLPASLAAGQVANMPARPAPLFTEPITAAGRGLTISAVLTRGELAGRPEVSSFEEAQVTKPCLA